MELKTQLQLIDKYEYISDRSLRWERACADLRSQYPIRAGICMGVKYDTKTDRYVAKFEINRKPCEFKLTTEVACFVLQALSYDQAPADYWLKMNDDGAVDDCFLVML